MTSAFTQQVCDKPPSFDFVAAHFACEENRYTPQNPNGFVNFGSAQNFLNAAELESRLAQNSWSADDAHYQPFAGTDACKVSIANYLSTQAQQSIDKKDIVVGNGIINVLEALAISLLDPNDTVIVPAPVFPGLVAAMRLRIKSRVAFLHLEEASQFRLTPTALETAIREEKSAGHKVKAVLLCSPGNPIGQVFDADELAAFVKIAEEHDCSLIVDEVYAASCFEGTDFQSVLALDSDRVYVLGGLSKDFGLAGFATGWLHSLNTDVMKAVAKQSHFYRLPAPAQRIIESMLKPTWRDAFIAANRQKLTRSATLVQNELQQLGIATSTTESGLCLWLDMREHLDEPTQAAEMSLYRYLLDEHRVHISPGSGFYCQTPGFFRLCFSQEEATLREGLRRLSAALKARTQKDSQSQPGKLSTETVQS